MEMGTYQQHGRGGEGGNGRGAGQDAEEEPQVAQDEGGVEGGGAMGGVEPVGQLPDQVGRGGVPCAAEWGGGGVGGPPVTGEGSGGRDGEGEGEGGSSPRRWMMRTLKDMLKLRREVGTQSRRTALTGAWVLKRISSTTAGEGGGATGREFSF